MRYFRFSFFRFIRKTLTASGRPIKMKGTNPKANNTPADNSKPQDSKGKGKENTAKDDLSKQFALVFDSVCLYCLNISPPLLIAFINALFQKSHSLNSKVDVLSGKSVGEIFLPRASDFVVRIAETINGIEKVFEYLIEFQSYLDPTIAYRISDYSNRQAWNLKKVQGTDIILRYPNTAEIYLKRSRSKGTPITVKHATSDGQILPLFQILTVPFFSRTLEENANDFLILLPFEILRYRERVRKNPSKKNLDLLSKHQDAITSILDEKKKAGILDDYRYACLKNALVILMDYAYSDVAALQEGGNKKMSIAEIKRSFNVLEVAKAWQDENVQLRNDKAQLQTKLDASEDKIRKLEEELRNLKANLT